MRPRLRMRARRAVERAGLRDCRQPPGWRAFPILAAMLLIFLAGPAAAASDAGDSGSAPLPERPARKETAQTGSTKPKKPGTSSAAGGWWGTVGALTAVLALVFLAAKVVRKSMPAATRALPPEVVQVLGRKPLDYRNTLHLVRLGSKLLVLGSSQEGLSTLSEVTDPVEVDYLAGLCRPAASTSLADSFNQLFRRIQSRPEGDEARDDAAGDDDLPPGASPSVDDEQEPDPAVLRLQARLHQPARQKLDRDDTGPTPEAAG